MSDYIKEEQGKAITEENYPQTIKVSLSLSTEHLTAIHYLLENTTKNKTVTKVFHSRMKSLAEDILRLGSKAFGGDS
jgi:hypothetical protein